jgi:Flp pilus assembly protein TadG
MTTGHRRHAGQALVEFALVFPIVVLLILALFDAGRAVAGFTTLTNAARHGVRVAIVNQSDSTDCLTAETSGYRLYKCAAAANTTGLGIRAPDVQDALVTGTGCPDVGCDVTVTVSWQYRAITPIIGALIGPRTIQASATMPIERAYSNP